MTNTQTQKILDDLNLPTHSLSPRLLSLVSQLSTLPYSYRPYIRNRISSFIKPELNEPKIKAFLRPILDILESLKSYKLHLQSTSTAIRASRKIYKVDSLSLVSQSNEKVLNYSRPTIDSTKQYVISDITRAIHKSYNKESETGLKKIAPLSSSASLYDLKKSEDRRLHAELVERVRGVCDYYPNHCNFYSLGVVITPSSKHYPYDCHGKKSKEWELAGFPTPRDTYDMMQKSWRNLRSRCALKGISLKGLMTPEPNKQGVPHLNFLLFLSNEKEAEGVIELIHEIFLGDDPDETQSSFSKKSSFRIYSNKLEEPLAWGMYITKNHRVDDDYQLALGLRSPTDASIDRSSEIDYEAIQHWHKTWNIRRYNFFGQKPIYFWRALQKLSSKVIHHTQKKSAPLPAKITQLWESAAGQTLHSQGSALGKYSYKDFLLLTESDHLHLVFLSSPNQPTTSYSSPSITLQKHTYTTNDPNKFFLTLRCTSDPERTVFLYKRNDLALFNRYLKRINNKRVYAFSMFTLQLSVTLLKNKPTQARRDLGGDSSS